MNGATTKMTVETTSFLSGGKIASNGSEKSQKILANHKNLIILLLVTILVLFCVSVSALQVTLLNRMSLMQAEIDELKQQRPSAVPSSSHHTAANVNSLIQEVGQLKLNVDHHSVAIDALRRNITDLRLNIAFEDDLLDDLEDFDRKYDQSDSKELSSADKTKFDDVGEDDDDEEGFEDEDDEGEDELQSGFGEDVPDSEDDQYDYGNEEEYPETTPASKEGESDDNNIYKDMKRARNSRRNPRSIAGLTEQGVPIINEPYGAAMMLRKNDTGDSDPAKVTERSPKLTKYQWGEHRRHHVSSGGSPRREHYSQHRLHHHQRPRQQDFAFAAAPVQHNFIGYGNRFNGTTTTTTSSTPISPHPPAATSTHQAPMHNRRSRVMHFEDKTAAFKQVVTKDELARMQEMRQLPEGFSSSSPATRQHHQLHHQQQQLATQQRRRMLPLRKGFELKNANPHHRITAVHYEGDHRMNFAGSHRDHGNGRITLGGDLYYHWKPADWTTKQGMTPRFFRMDRGVLTVNDHGLFLIYAQVSYADKQDTNSYKIELNDREVYRCTTMTQTHPHKHQLKTNSCYTSGLLNLSSGDRIQLKNLSGDRNVTMEAPKTFFGLVKINFHPMMPNAEAESLEI